MDRIETLHCVFLMITRAAPSLLTFALLLVAPGLTLAAEAPAASTDPAAAASVFEYDRSAPLDPHEVGQYSRDDASIRDITFVGAKTPVQAYLVSPARPGNNLAAILWVHWLGERET